MWNHNPTWSPIGQRYTTLHVCVFIDVYMHTNTYLYTHIYSYMLTPQDLQESDKGTKSTERTLLR